MMVEALSTVSFDIGREFATPALQNPAQALNQTPTVFEVGEFASALDQVKAPQASTVGDTAAVESSSFRSVIENLESLNGRVDLLSDASLEYASGAREFTPGDMLEMTVRSHQFLFQCELTANVANRSSDGVQQLFRQQS